MQRPGTAQKAANRAAEAATVDDGRGVHRRQVRDFETSEEGTRDARLLSERCRDYYDSKQLTSSEVYELRKRGQPEIIINRIQTKVNYLLGYEASQRTDPRGYPRTPQDEDAAGACTDALRYLRDKCELEQVFSDVWENILVEGFGGCELGVDTLPNGERGEITVTFIPWDRLFYDPHSRKHDFSDARYLGIVIWMDEDDAKARWPNSESEIARTIDEDITRTYSDRPAWQRWAQSTDCRRVRVVQMYRREGYDWYCSIFTRGGVLEEWRCEWQDAEGRSFCPLIMQSAFVDRQNNRYGFVKSLLWPQDEINKRRSKLLHLAMGRPFVYEEGAVDDVDETKRELAKANGGVKINPGMKFELLDNRVEVSGHTELLQHATQEIDLQGPNSVMQGKGERSASGRAKMVDQQGGQIEIYRLMDRFNSLKHRVYKSQWAMIRQEWTAQKWIRVTDDDKNVKFVGFNRPVSMAEDLVKQAVANGVPEDEAKQHIMQQAQDSNIRAQLSQVVRVENNPCEMDMDIIIEDVPDTANLQQEQFEILAQLAQAGIQFPPKVYIKASGLRDKSELLKALEESQQNPQAQAAGQAQMEEMAAKIEKLKADIDLVKANTVKTLADADAVNMNRTDVINPTVITPSQAPAPIPAPTQQGMLALPSLDQGQGQGPVPQNDMGGYDSGIDPTQPPQMPPLRNLPPAAIPPMHQVQPGGY